MTSGYIDTKIINRIEIKDCLNHKNFNDIKLSVAPISTILSLRCKDKQSDSKLYPTINMNLLQVTAG